MLSTTGLANFSNQNSTAGYQGDYAEKEAIGSTNSFELRLYDARIGRWMTTDPYGEYHSPYLGMGNNWVNQVDPDGGEDWYRDKETGDIVWFDGSKEIEGYKHLGYNYSTRDAYNNWTIYDGDLKASFYNGELVDYYDQLDNVEISVDNRSFIDRTSNYASDFIAPFVEIPQFIIFPIVNQINIGFKEGLHPGRAYDFDNYVFTNTYQFENFTFRADNKLSLTSSTGTPNLNDAKGIINNTIDVIPLGITATSNPVTDYIIENEIIKRTLKQAVHNIPEN